LSQTHLKLQTPDSQNKDIFLIHNSADKPWVEDLAERIEAQTFENRHLGVVFDKWDFRKGANIVLEMEKYLDSSRFIGVVVSKAMLQAEWPTLERTIAVWSDPSGAKGRVIPLLRGNVTLPPTLRVRNWIDFRDDDKFDMSFRELVAILRGESFPRGRGSLLPTIKESKLPFEPAPVVITASLGAEKVRERIVSNLYPVLEIPELVFSAETPFREKSDVSKACKGASLAPFLLRESKLFTFDSIAQDSAFRGALEDKATPTHEQFANWFSEPEMSRWALELLNISLRQHAWRRHLRFDKSRSRFFFPPPNGKPKRIWWYIGGRRRPREVTTPHMGWKQLEDGKRAQVQYGWRHQGFRSSFVRISGALFLRLEPTYLLTRLDGKTPVTHQWVGPILSHWINQERNGQILRTLRFWSLVLAQNQEAIRIATGQNPICVSLTPLSGFCEYGIANDQMDYDALMSTAIEDDLFVPQLEMFGEESAIRNEEERPSAEL
jgi:hypothetical protein